MRAKVLEIAAHRLEAAPEDLEIEDGRISVAGTPARRRRSPRSPAAYLNPAGPPGMEMGLEAKARYTPTRRRSRGRTPATPARARSTPAPAP